MLRIYGIRNCDTMKKAFAWLDAQGLAYEFVDYRGAGVVAGRLPHWREAAGWQALLNTRGQTWRRLPEADRAEVDEARALVLMRDWPTLIRRPVVEVGDTVVVGLDALRSARLR